MRMKRAFEEFGRIRLEDWPEGTYYFLRGVEIHLGTKGNETKPAIIFDTEIDNDRWLAFTVPFKQKTKLERIKSILEE